MIVSDKGGQREDRKTEIQSTQGHFSIYAQLRGYINSRQEEGETQNSK